MKKVLLINTDYFEEVYGKSRMKGVLSRGIPVLGLACLAAPLVKSGHDVTILDLNLYSNPEEILLLKLRELQADVVGMTATTAIVPRVIQIAATIKNISPQTTVVVGGPHPTALPEDLLKNSQIDIVVVGEGDIIFKYIVEEKNIKNIPNVYYKENGKIHHSSVLNESITDLDSLPFPAYSLYNIEKYTMPKIFARKSPVTFMETSRGCYAHCVYCNKNIHGYKLRQKSSKRVVDEMEYMLQLGFKEIHIIDDVFTANMKRAYDICEEILRRGLTFPWYPRGGIRVDRVNRELLSIMKKAGCYRIPFGIESGSQRVIDVIKKKITIEQAENAVKLAKNVGLEVECYFMIGLPTETQEDILKSITFAKKLDPDYVKFAITIPLPGTEMFDDLMKNNRIKSMRWEDYNFAASLKDLYQHENLTWKQLDYFYSKSHRDFYLRPKYITRKIYSSIKNGQFSAFIEAFLKTKWF